MKRKIFLYIGIFILIVGGFFSFQNLSVVNAQPVVYESKTVDITTGSGFTSGVVTVTINSSNASPKVFTIPLSNPALPQVTLTASPASISSGGSATLTSTVSGATSCTASGGTWSYTGGTTGSTDTVSGITTTATYTLTCSNANGPSSASATVTVTNSTGTISASPNPCIDSGSGFCTSTIAWNSTGTSKVIVYTKTPGTSGIGSPFTSCSSAGAGGVSSSQPASWIPVGGSYVFNLYDCSSGSAGASPIATVTVSGSSSNTCPTGNVSLNATAINVGQTTSASAPAGFTGGTFASSNAGIASVSGSTINGISGGTAVITGSGWTASNGAKNCSLGGSAITISSSVCKNGNQSACSSTPNACGQTITGVKTCQVSETWGPCVPAVNNDNSTCGSGASCTITATPSSGTAPLNTNLKWTTTSSGTIYDWCGISTGGSYLALIGMFYTKTNLPSSGNLSVSNLNNTSTFNMTCGWTNIIRANYSCATTVTINSTATCPTTGNAVSLTNSGTVKIGNTITASAPAGFTGGTFSSTAPSVASVSGTTVTGVSTGSTNIFGSGWTASNGAKNCALTGTPATVPPACPVASVTLASNSINTGQTTTASALGFSGGTFSSSNPTIATVTGSTLTGVGSGSTNITGAGWTNVNGATGCTLNAAALTVSNAVVNYALTINKTTGGSVASSLGGLACVGNVCTANYLKNASVILTATPTSSSYKFLGWTGACSGTSSTCNLTMDSAKTVNANFSPIPGNIKEF